MFSFNQGIAVAIHLFYFAGELRIGLSTGLFQGFLLPHLMAAVAWFDVFSPLRISAMTKPDFNGTWGARPSSIQFA
jgi:hypothetical protein